MKYLLPTLLTLTLLAGPTLAQNKKTPKVKVQDGGMSRGTQQIAGGDGIFGVVYTLNNDFNFTILSAKYTIEPHNDYEGTMASKDEKLVCITFAVKNSDKEKTRDWSGLDVTLVDDSNQNYSSGNSEGHTMLTSQGNKSNYVSLLPGQGIGQDPVKDELSCAIAVPAKAKIVKIILNQGRKTVTGEKIVRYNIAGNPGGSPKNIIAPLPKYIADATDPTGATLAIPGTTIPGKYYPDGAFAVRFNGLTITSDPIFNKMPPDDGKVYVVLSFTAKNIFSKKISTFDFYAEQTHEITLRDADGEKYPVAGDENYAFRHAKRDEALQSTEMEVGEEFSYRYIFMIPKDVKPASVTYGQSRYGHAYKLDLTNLK